MAKKKNKKLHSIYYIDANRVRSELIEGHPVTMDDIVDAIAKKAEQYEEQVVKDDLDTKSFKVKLLFFGQEKYNNDLSSFCKSFVKDDQEIVQFKPKVSSSVLFVWNESHIFAITTGQGFRVVGPYCMPKFGLRIAGSFEEDFGIIGLTSNVMASTIHSRRTTYTNEVDFLNINSLDTISKEITGSLSDQDRVRKLLQLSENSRKKSMRVIAKDFIQLGSSLDFNGLLHLLKWICQFDFTQLNDIFNQMEPLNTKRDAEAIKHLDSQIAYQIYENIKDGQDIHFDLFHKEVDKFIQAEVYTIQHNGHILIESDYCPPPEIIRDSYDEYLKHTSASDNFATFHDYFLNVKLEASFEDNIITSDSLLRHISGEILEGDTNYYVFYGEYFKLGAHYTARLNDDLHQKLQRGYYVSEIKTPWYGGSEDNFNKRVSEEESYVHLHKVMEGYIEFADLLKLENNSATIVHVKIGFDGSMRVLERQVELSIKRMQDLQKNNQEAYMRSIYRRAKDANVGRNIENSFSSEQEFIDAMRTCTFRYVIALLLKGDKVNVDLMNTRSNIAKHCLNSLIHKCFEAGVDLKINKIAITKK